MKLVKTGELPFHAVTRENLQPPRPVIPIRRAPDDSRPRTRCCPRVHGRRGCGPGRAHRTGLEGLLVYGMPCAIYHQLPAAYYLAARFREISNPPCSMR
jgi:hypothetical protein